MPTLYLSSFKASAKLVAKVDFYLDKHAHLFPDDSQKVSYLMQYKDSSNWPNDKILSNEFESIGFYISNHPLNDYQDILQQNKVKTFKEFENSTDHECFMAGTIMSVKEKKTAKGNSYAIVKFSDLSKVFELFLFSEILESNRKILVEGKSFILTIIKDKENKENKFRRISVRKIVPIENVVKQNYNNVHIELESSNDLDKLYDTIKEKGDTKIKISINEVGKKYLFELKEKRKFDAKTFESLNKERFIKKINV